MLAERMIPVFKSIMITYIIIKASNVVREFHMSADQFLYNYPQQL